MQSHEVTPPALALKNGKTEIPSRKFPRVVNSAVSKTVFADTACFPDIQKIVCRGAVLGPVGGNSFGGRDTVSEPTEDCSPGLPLTNRWGRWMAGFGRMVVHTPVPQGREQKQGAGEIPDIL